ncbi:SpcZ [Kitasatospora sp. NPDC048545]|uniref:SpcZ n=1 Tax=Kitasatospora sp. NPDC048545 TaxID=3157208 RepID=UPI0033F70DD9
MTSAETFSAFHASLDAVAGDAGHPAAGERSAVPAWLAQVAEVLFDGLDADAAADWARRVRREVRRSDGGVPFSVVHDWYCSAVGPVLAEATARRGGSAVPQQVVLALHARALGGGRVDEGTWRAALEPELRELFRHAYPYAEAYATAAAAAGSYALANGYDEAEAARYGETYAELNTTANVRAHADANALANAAAVAAAYAAADPDAYAETYPSARVRAVVRVHADGQGERGERAAWARLADGLAAALARAAARTEDGAEARKAAHTG